MSSDFQENQKIEAQDQYGKWYVARVIQVDHEEKEVLIHFEGWNSRYDEWISCNSFRLRPLSMENKRKIQDKRLKKFQVGDPVQARWVNGKYYPATVKVIDNLCDKVTVQFEDNVEHTVVLKDIRPQKKPDKQSEWAKLQQEAKERESRHTNLARKLRAKKRVAAELDTSGESPKQQPSGTPSKKPRLEGDEELKKAPVDDNIISPQTSVTVSESGNVSPLSSADGSKSPAVSKRKAYTPLRTQYSLRETVIPIQPLSFEQHGKTESPSKITRRTNSAEDNEDPLQPSGKAAIKQAAGSKKGKHEEMSGKRKRVARETSGKQPKKIEQEAIPAPAVSAVMSASSPEPLFLTPPLDVTSKVANVSSGMSAAPTIHPTLPYTPTHEAAAHVSTAEDHMSASTSSNDASANMAIASESKDTSSSFQDKSPPPLPPNDPKSISLTCFNVDILNTEDDKSASPAVVTIDPNAVIHSPVNGTEPTSSVAECNLTEERLFVEYTKKTASIISTKTSPKRPSLLPFRRRSLSASADQAPTKSSVSGRGRRRSEGGRSSQAKRRVLGTGRTSSRLSSTAESAEKDMAPKELVIKMDHNDFKCHHPDCGKSFRKESLLQWHYKHYHPGQAHPPTTVARPKTKSPIYKSPVQKSPVQKVPSNKQLLSSVPPTPPTLLAVAKQHEQAMQSATQAIAAGLSKVQEKSKAKKILSAVVTTIIPTLPLISLTSHAPINVISNSSISKELPITTKISVPKEPVISHFLPTVGTASNEVKNLGVTALANEPTIKLPSSVAMELLKGSAVRMIAPKPSVIQASGSTSSASPLTPTTATTHSPVGTVFKGFPPVTVISSSAHMSWVTRNVTSTPRPSSPGRKGVVIRGHPRGETSRSRGATISHVSDDSSVEDLDVGEEYRPSGERRTRASRPFGSSSCSYYCSGNKDDVIHCLCGSFEDEGFMIQCEQCLCWQHADCVGIDEEQPPEHYLCCICQSPHALRKNAKFKYDRGWYKEGNLPNLVGGAAFAHSEDVISAHKISGSLASLNQCLHSLEQLLAVAGQPNHALLKHWDSGKESAITRRLTQRLTSMLKDRELAENEEEQSSDLTDSLEKAARTTPINELQLGGGASNNNHTKQPLQLSPLPPIDHAREDKHLQNFDDKQSSCASDASINVTSIASLQLPPLPPHRRKLFDDESNCSTPGTQNLSTISTPLADEDSLMEHSGLDLLTEVAATCSRISTPSTISQDKSPMGNTPVLDGDSIASSSVTAASLPVTSFMDEFGMEEASVFALTPSTVTTPELDQPITSNDLQLPPSEASPDDGALQTTAEETESHNQNMQSVMELVERLTSDLDTTAQLLPLVSPSQFAEAFMKVDTSCWASRMLLLDHVEAMQEKVLAQMDQLEEQFKGITEVQYKPDGDGSKKNLLKKIDNWCSLDITSVA